MAEMVDKGDERLMRLGPQDYSQYVTVENGIPLTVLFPDGLSVTFRGDEIIDVSPDPTEKMRELGLLKTK